MSSETSTARDVGKTASGDAVWKRGILAVVLSTVVNGVILGVVLATGVVSPFRPLAGGPVLFLSAVGAVGAVVTYGLLSRFTERADRNFLVVAAVVLLLSLVPDVTFLPGQPGATWGAIAVLMVMHVTVAVVSVGALLYGR